MPSISTQYTPFESLLFLQSIARNGADFSIFPTISLSLNTNRLVQSDEKYDAQRLAPEALKSLYDELINVEDVTSAAVNESHSGGESISQNNSLSAPLEDSGRDNGTAAKASQIADRFYSRYKERIIQELTDEEKKYQTLVVEIKSLEDENSDARKPEEAVIQNGLSIADQLPSSNADESVLPAKDAPVTTARPAPDGMSTTGARSKEEQPQLAESRLQHPPPGQMLPPQTPSLEPSFPPSPSATAAVQRPTAPVSQASPVPPHAIPVPGQQQLPNFPQRYSPMQPPLPLPSTTSPRSSNALPPISSIVPQPPPQKTSPAPRKSSGTGASRASPLLPSPSPPYQQPPPYGYPYPAWPQYNSPTSQYANPQFYPPHPMTRNLPPAQSPSYNQYPSYHHPALPNQYIPGPYPHPPVHGQTPPYAPFPWSGQPPAVVTTPSVKRSLDRPGVRAPRTSTPWTPGGTRQGSPERPVRERDVSPLSDRAPSPDEPIKESKEAERNTTPKDSPPKAVSKRVPARNLHGRRAGSTQSSALASRSRSQSAASIASESHPGRAVGTKLASCKIKHEAPSTPAPLTSDSEQRSSGRRRGRSDGLQPAASELARTSSKRKREMGTDASPSPSLPTPRPFGSRIRPRPEPADPSLVAITRNFARKAAPILNDVNAHKLAGIFAKPLTERDAPGYKDLIYRPQDLKSIRAAVGRGSRAANAMIDELENAKAAEAGQESPAAAITTKASTTTPSGSILVSKTEDLTPPKGIVNSAQLEMEFMRVFANAVMFNPLPPSERGVPPELKKLTDSTNQRLRSRKSRSKEADDAGGGGGNGEDDAAAAAEVVEKKGYAVEEEGGIIHDTREMFASVEKAVLQWRSVEQGYIDDVPRSSAGLGLAVGLGLRVGSVSASVSDVPAEESGLEEGERERDRDRDVASGNTRKRRRLAE
ncbi:hypothetical protein EPUS_05876 [Endocarpon pusillum Z07020]|uniref:Bromo domain-containing protein n=1 Tax=Endocarpon pusillum (strain Z07020 / HMAS-L-300199) TaxID=1263415 RepID=U1HWS2_ENDPU|nr:uncharacterized protein EPUS_05876 [Endocarpon pusillum Z07020]ERF73864.1 hypothetical protein EPUS_05876 [Endocarpon pusillum Z07020]